MEDSKCFRRIRKRNLIKISKSLLFLVIVFNSIFLSFAYSMHNISLNLQSDKTVYQVGENVSLFLNISNKNNQSVSGQIMGKVLIGDIGYQIQCFDYTSPANSSQDLGLSPLTATFSNSNTKTMSTLYACLGTRMQSTKTIIDNNASIANNNNSETFKVGPFTYSYTLNGSDYQVKSNTINITIIPVQNQTNKQINQQTHYGQSQQQNPQTTSNSPSNQNTKQINQQNQNTYNNNTQLSSNSQKALTNSEQNAQSINQIKKQITNSNNIKSNNLKTSGEKDIFWPWFIFLILIIIIILVIFFKYYNKKEEKINEITEEKKEEIPKYIRFLDDVRLNNPDKQNAMKISQAIRNYIAISSGIESELTHSQAMNLTDNKFLKDILEKTELIEFANKKIKLNYEEIVKKLRGVME